MGLTHFANTTPTKVLGVSRALDTVMLIPTGSFGEPLNGLTHLFEHLAIVKIHKELGTRNIYGYTTEDYIILFFKEVEPGQLRNLFKNMVFTEDDIKREKAAIYREIEQYQNSEQELFFKFLWQYTPYEKSPLGLKEDVKAISPVCVNNLAVKVAGLNLLIWTPDGLDEETRIDLQGSFNPSLKANRFVKDRKFDGRHYHIYYFRENIEKMMLLTRILQILNPDKHIQLSEKRELCALCLEKGTRNPNAWELPRLKRLAFRQIMREARDIEKNFKEKALNELESLFLFGKTWCERLKLLFGARDSELIHLMRSYEI